MGEPFRLSARYYDAYYTTFLDYGTHCDRMGEIFKEHGMESPLRILDIACGTGTHCIELSQRGHSCVGIDVSPEMIQEAMSKMVDMPAKVCPQFLVQDMKSLDLEGKFDVAICMFGGFGYLERDEDLKRFFQSLRKNLRPEGLFLFEFWNVGGLKDSPYKTWGKAPINDVMFYVLSESKYDFDQSVLNISMEYLIHREGDMVNVFTEEHRVRIYSLSEIRHLLSTNRVEMLEVYEGRHMESLVPPSKDTFRIFTVAGTKGN